MANELELTKCNEDLYVYADTEEAVNVEFDYFSRNYPWIQLYKGTESILHANSGWHFATQGNPQVAKTFVSGFINSGIYSKLYEIYIKKLYSVRVLNTRKVVSGYKWNRVEPVKLSGSIFTLFLLYCSLLAIVMGVFLSEIRSLIYSSAKSCFEKCIEYFWMLVRFIKNLLILETF